MKTKNILVTIAAPVIVLSIIFATQTKARPASADEQPTDFYLGVSKADGFDGEHTSYNPQPIVPQLGPAMVISVTTNDPAANPGDTFCSLIEAIDNANSDSDTSGGDCPAGSGADVIVLGTAVTYTLSISNSTAEGDNGLPVITSTITISGQGSTIARDLAAPAFRILFVGTGGDGW